MAFFDATTHPRLPDWTRGFWALSSVEAGSAKATARKVRMDDRFLFGCDVGTDIHPRFEAKIGGAWAEFMPSYACSWCDGSGLSRQGGACFGCKGTRIEHGPKGGAA